MFYGSNSYSQSMMGNPNILPPQQVLQANGKASISALRMSPNSSALILDSTAPIVWLCTSDSIGNVTSTPYDIAPHKDTPTPDVNSIESRLTTVETKLDNILDRWEELVNAKSNAGSPKPKQSSRDSGPN